MDRNKLEKIISTIIEIIDVDKIYIFGSYARGEATEDSDIDMYIIVKEEENINTRNKYNNILVKIKNNLYNNNVYPKGGLDLLLNDNKEFDNKKKINGNIEYIVNKEGVLIYE